MNGLTQIKDKEGILYDVRYDLDFDKFIIWEHNNLKMKDAYFTRTEIKNYIETEQISIYKDENNIFKKYLNK